MIFTVTFNPSLDYIVRVDEMRLGTINRTNYEQLLPGGKGINVSIVLGNLGHPSRALGFSAGGGRAGEAPCGRRRGRGPRPRQRGLHAHQRQGQGR